MEGVDRRYFSLRACLLDLFEHMGPQGGDLRVDLLGDPGGVAFQFVQDEQGQVRMLGQEVDVSGDDLCDLFVDGGCFVQQVDGDAFYELPEVVHHDDVEQFFLTTEVVVKEGQVDAGFFGDVAGAGGGEAILGKELFGCLHDFFLRG